MKTIVSISLVTFCLISTFADAVRLAQSPKQQHKETVDKQIQLDDENVKVEITVIPMAAVDVNQAAPRLEENPVTTMHASEDNVALTKGAVPSDSPLATRRTPIIAPASQENARPISYIVPPKKSLLQQRPVFLAEPKTREFLEDVKRNDREAAAGMASRIAKVTPKKISSPKTSPTLTGGALYSPKNGLVPYFQSSRLPPFRSEDFHSPPRVPSTIMSNIPRLYPAGSASVFEQTPPATNSLVDLPAAEAVPVDDTELEMKPHIAANSQFAKSDAVELDKPVGLTAAMDVAPAVSPIPASRSRSIPVVTRKGSVVEMKANIEANEGKRLVTANGSYSKSTTAAQIAQSQPDAAAHVKSGIRMAKMRAPQTNYFSALKHAHQEETKLVPEERSLRIQPKAAINNVSPLPVTSDEQVTITPAIVPDVAAPSAPEGLVSGNPSVVEEPISVSTIKDAEVIDPKNVDAVPLDLNQPEVPAHAKPTLRVSKLRRPSFFKRATTPVQMSGEVTESTASPVVVEAAQPSQPVRTPKKIPVVKSNPVPFQTVPTSPHSKSPAPSNIARDEAVTHGAITQPAEQAHKRESLPSKISKLKSIRTPIAKMPLQESAPMEQIPSEVSQIGSTKKRRKDGAAKKPSSRIPMHLQTPAKAAESDSDYEEPLAEVASVFSNKFVNVGGKKLFKAPAKSKKVPVNPKVRTVSRKEKAAVIPRPNLQDELEAAGEQLDDEFEQDVMNIEVDADSKKSSEFEKDEEWLDNEDWETMDLNGVTNINNLEENAVARTSKSECIRNKNARNALIAIAGGLSVATAAGGAVYAYNMGANVKPSRKVITEYKTTQKPRLVKKNRILS